MATDVGVEASVDWGEALILEEEEAHGKLLRLSALPREGEKSAEEDMRAVALPPRLRV